MPIDTATTITPVTTSTPRRNILVSGVVIRVFIALVISWLIVMAFFITTVASH